MPRKVDVHHYLMSCDFQKPRKSLVSFCRRSFHLYQACRNATRGEIVQKHIAPLVLVGGFGIRRARNQQGPCPVSVGTIGVPGLIKRGGASYTSLPGLTWPAYGRPMDSPGISIPSLENSIDITTVGPIG